MFKTIVAITSIIVLLAGCSYKPVYQIPEGYPENTRYDNGTEGNTWNREKEETSEYFVNFNGNKEIKLNVLFAKLPSWMNDKENYFDSLSKIKALCINEYGKTKIAESCIASERSAMKQFLQATALYSDYIASGNEQDYFVICYEYGVKQTENMPENDIYIFGEWREAMLSCAKAYGWKPGEK